MQHSIPHKCSNSVLTFGVRYSAWLAVNKGTIAPHNKNQRLKKAGPTPPKPTLFVRNIKPLLFKKFL